MRQLSERWFIEDIASGQGASASVFKGFDGENDMQTVAIKLFHGVRAENPVLQTTFQNELKVFSDLSHPNIVKFIDWGDDADRHPYLVLEWVPQDLTAFLRANPVEGWDHFAPMALAILSGLSHIHEKGHVHRDIKPANVLVGDGAVPKITDFGISKLRDNVVYHGVTFMNCGTPAYMPPSTLADGHTPADSEEPMTRRFDRDVYSFAALVVEVLAFRPLTGEGDAEKALEEADLQPYVYDVLAASLSRDPKDRPATAGDVLRRLEAFQAERERGWRQKIVVPVSISRVAIERVAALTGMSTERAQAFILEDLNGNVALKTLEVADQAQGQYRQEDLSVVAVAFKYRLRQDSQDPSIWAVIRAVKNSAFNDSDREHGFRDNLVFKPQAQCGSRSREDADRLFDAVAEHVQERQAQERGDAVRQLFSRWSKVLYAKKLHEEGRGRPVRYTQVRVEGRRVWLEVGRTASEELIGEPRVIRLGDSRSLRGEVEYVADGRLSFYVETGSLDDIPATGELQYDADAAKSALKRQDAALNAVKHGRSVRGDLRELLARPASVRPPRPLSDLTFFRDDLDECKRQAVGAALGLDDLIVVEGPPGTGKTTFIAELVAQFKARNPDARVLLSSQTHAALDNALEKIHALVPELRLVRLGRAERISAEVDHLRLDPQLEAWRKDVFEASEAFLKRKAAEWGVSASQAEISSLVASIREALKRIAGIRSQMKRGQDERRVAAQQLEELNALAPEILNVAERLESLLRDQPAGALEQGVRTYVDTGLELAAALEDSGDAASVVAEYDERLNGLRSDLKTAVEEERSLRVRLAESLEREPGGEDDAEELLDAAAHYVVEDERLAVLDDLHQEWRRRFGRSQDFAAALVASADVVATTCVGGRFGSTSELEFDLCIIDEISKASPTEALIPMARSRRWVLVGDRKQLPPFQEAALAGEVMREHADLPSEALGETLLDCMADALPRECHFTLSEQHRMTPAIGNLVSECFYDGGLISAPKEVPDYVLRAFGKPVVWLDTSSSSKRLELQASGSTSYSNELEADAIRTLMTSLAFYAQGQPLSVAVLTGYADQRDLVRKVLHAAAGSIESIDYEVATVDAFQGREADVCIFSLVRSNEDGKLGFLSYQQRINVALSRGCTGLAIVGDAAFVKTAKGSSNPLSDVHAYICRNPDSCAISQVEE